MKKVIISGISSLQEAFDFWAAFTGLNNSKLYNNIDQEEHKLEQIFI